MLRKIRFKLPFHSLLTEMCHFEGSMQCLEIADWIEMTSSRDNPDLVVLAGDFNSRPGDLPVQVCNNTPFLSTYSYLQKIILIKWMNSENYHVINTSGSLFSLKKYEYEIFRIRC